MKLIKTEDASEGLTVAKDVTDLKGILLFKKGTALTEASLRAIKSRHVTHLFVDEPGKGGGGSVGGFNSAEEVDKDLDLAFGDTVSNPIMADLCAAAKKFFKDKLS